MKRFTPTRLLTASLMLAASTLAASAQTALQSGIYKFFFNADSASVALTRNNTTPYSGDFVVPDSIEYEGVMYPVTTMKNSVFASNQVVTSVYIPDNCNIDGLTSLCNNAQKLTSIRIPPTTKKIGNYFCVNCKDLGWFDMPKTVETIGINAFFATGITEIDLPDGLTSLGTNCFAQSALESIEIPEGITTIAKQAFGQCLSLAKVKLPSRLKTIDYGGFWSSTALTEIEIPASVDSIGELAFQNSGLKSVIIPDGVRYIPARCFSACNAMESIELGPNVVYIGIYGINGKALTSITCKAVTPPTVADSTAFALDKSAMTLYVPAESVDAYKAHAQWGRFPNIQPIDGSITAVPAIATPSVKVTADAGTIRISGAEAGSAVRVTAANGALVSSTIITTGETTIGVAKGVYLVSVGDTTQKVLVK